MKYIGNDVLEQEYIDNRFIEDKKYQKTLVLRIFTSLTSQKSNIQSYYSKIRYKQNYSVLSTGIIYITHYVPLIDYLQNYIKYTRQKRTLRNIEQMIIDDRQYNIMSFIRVMSREEQKDVVERITYSIKRQQNSMIIEQITFYDIINQIEYLKEQYYSEYVIQKGYIVENAMITNKDRYSLTLQDDYHLLPFIKEYQGDQLIGGVDPMNKILINNEVPQNTSIKIVYQSFDGQNPMITIYDKDLQKVIDNDNMQSNPSNTSLWFYNYSFANDDQEYYIYVKDVQNNYDQFKTIRTFSQNNNENIAQTVWSYDINNTLNSTNTSYYLFKQQMQRRLKIHQNYFKLKEHVELKLWIETTDGILTFDPSKVLTVEIWNGSSMVYTITVQPTDVQEYLTVIVPNGIFKVGSYWVKIKYNTSIVQQSTFDVLETLYNTEYQEYDYGNFVIYV